MYTLAAKIMNEKEFISELAHTKSKQKKLKSRHIILAYKKHISLALQDGYTFTDIFNLLKDKNLYPYSYNAFVRALKIIMDKPIDNIRSDEPSDKGSKTNQVKTEDGNGFSFNPKVQNTNELI